MPLISITLQKSILNLSIDLAWKTVKAFLEEYHNTRCVSPKTCLREAFHTGLIDYDDYWIELANVRNNTVHTYNEVLAEEIYKKLPKALTYFQKLFTAMEHEKNQSR